MKQLDNILHDLRAYYNTVKTKRQLGNDVPAGFRWDSVHKQQFNIHSPPRKSTSLPVQDTATSVHISDVQNKSNQTEMHYTSLDLPFKLPDTVLSNSPIADQSTLHRHTPLIRSVDKVSSSLPKSMSMTEDFLRS